VSAEIVTVSDATFEQDVLKSDTPVVVDFWAEWCGPCHMLAPVVEKLAGEFQGRLKFAKLDVDQNPHVPGHYGIRGIPTLIVFQGGAEVGRMVGFQPEDRLRLELEQQLQPA
jgi:thioredoxin 1